MQTYSETKDPNETKDYSCDWNPKLGSDTISTQTVTLVDAAGATSPANSHADGISKVFLSGGDHGGKIVYTIRITTSGGKTFEEAFGVLIVDSVIGGIPTELDELKADLVAVNAAIRKVASGERVKETARDGRRIVKENTPYDTLLKHKKELERAIEAAENVSTIGRKRRAIRLGWT